MDLSPAIEKFLKCVRKSSLISPTDLERFVEQVKAGGELPTEPIKLARKMVAAGLLTIFQAEQLLQNRSRNFVLAGKFKVLERISSGPMSSVFLCEHVVMKRLVALKMLPAEKAQDPTSVARFHREARAAARLQHPNVVAIHDLDSANGLTFLVAEYVDGSDLDRVVAKGGPMSIARAADCIRQAALGLQHAYEMGMVHRDIKPGNLLMDRSGTVKLLDLGLARLLADENDDQSADEESRMILGTIDYLSPEQAQDSSAVDIRADIYSLGATAFFLLAGRPLFEGATTAQKLVMHYRRSAEPIIRGLPGIPDDFADVLIRMLSKDPDDRYQTPAEVAEAMAPWADEENAMLSVAELPKLCLATRQAIDNSRSKIIKIPSRTSAAYSLSAIERGLSNMESKPSIWRRIDSKPVIHPRKRAFSFGALAMAVLSLVPFWPWGSPSARTSTPRAGERYPSDSIAHKGSRSVRTMPAS